MERAASGDDSTRYHDRQPALLLDDARRDVRCDQLDRRVAQSVQGADPCSRRRLHRCGRRPGAHDILVSLIPTSKTAYDVTLAARLTTLPAVPASQGVRVGQTVANRIIAWRKADGSAVTPPRYVLPPLPGLWQPTPPAFAKAGFTHFPNVKPFALLTTTQFLPERPPTLTSSRYAADFNETKRTRVGVEHRAHRSGETARLGVGRRPLADAPVRPVEQRRAGHCPLAVSCPRWKPHDSSRC